MVISDKIKGDVKVFINVENKTEFIRDGLDLLHQKKITLKEALCGFSFDIKHLSGKTYTINNTNGKIITTMEKVHIHGIVDRIKVMYMLVNIKMIRINQKVIL